MNILPDENKKYDLYIIEKGKRTKICKVYGREIEIEINRQKELLKFERENFPNHNINRYIEYFPKKNKETMKGCLKNCYYILLYTDAKVY